MTRLHVKVLYIFLLLSVGTGFVLGYNHIKLTKERTSLEQAIKGFNKKVALLQRKYAEQRALTERNLREKSVLAGQKRALETEVERLGKKTAPWLRTTRRLTSLRKN